MSRIDRLREQLEWVASSNLDGPVKAEALFVEMDAFFESAPPETEEEESLLLEARCLMTLFMVPFTPLVRRYLHDRLHRSTD